MMVDDTYVTPFLLDQAGQILRRVTRMSLQVANSNSLQDDLNSGTLPELGGIELRSVS